MAKRILLVDDEPFNLELMSELLEDAGYNTVQACDGEHAWQTLNSEGEPFSAILLDKMMPGISGVELLKRIKATERLAFLPVIMQTAVGAAASVQESLAGGAFYYLTKPFSRDMLLAVVAAATEHWNRHQYFVELTTQQLDALQYLQHATFSVRTLADARSISALLARTSNSPEKTATGLFELIVNAIEHGNLELDYQQKTQLQHEDRWQEVLQQRLDDPRLGARHVCVSLQRVAGQLHFTIRDEGTGFEWQNYLRDDIDQLISSHGRGILIARKLSFNELHYRGCGNEVLAIVYN